MFYATNVEIYYTITFYATNVEIYYTITFYATNVEMQDHNARRGSLACELDMQLNKWVTYNYFYCPFKHQHTLVCKYIYFHVIIKPF